MFHHRKDAGDKLGKCLLRHQAANPIVLAFPGLGAEVGYQVAKILDAPYSILGAWALAAPGDVTGKFGAIAEDGSVFLLPNAVARLGNGQITTCLQQQRANLKARVSELRGGAALPDLQDRHIILVDDGLMSGVIARAAIMCCRHQGARHITISAPVATTAARELLYSHVNDMVTLLTPPMLMGIEECYQQRQTLSETNLKALMNTAHHEGMLATA